MRLTTDQVREAFATMEDEAATQENHVNFDKWLFAERQRVAELAIAKERERIIQLLHSDAGRNILVKGGNAFGNAIMLEVLIKGEE